MRQPCRGATSLRPHPYGPHSSATHVFWPEIIAAQSVSLCRGVNLLRPHPDGHHTSVTHVFWPEAITARALRRCAANVATTFYIFLPHCYSL
jgi:hypothetical protein